MGVGSGRQEDRGPRWIFKLGTDKAEGGLMVLAIFSVLFFFRCPSLLEIFLPMPLLRMTLNTFHQF